MGKKLPLYPTVEEEVLALMERVSEAQRYAHMVSVLFYKETRVMSHDVTYRVLLLEWFLPDGSLTHL